MKSYNVKDYDIVYDHQYLEALPEEKRGPLSDSSALSLAWRPGHKEVSTLIKDCTIDGRAASEGLKLSFRSNVYVRGCLIFGGYEDCVDIVRGNDIVFDDCTFMSMNSKQHITIKGGAHNIIIKDCLFVNKYRKWYDGACLDLGNWTNYDIVKRPRVRNITINNCKTFDTGSILARILYSDPPQVINTEGNILRVPRLVTNLFYWMRRKGWLGKLFIPDKNELILQPKELCDKQ